MYSGMTYYELIHRLDWSQEEYITGVQKAISKGQANSYCGNGHTDVSAKCSDQSIHLNKHHIFYVDKSTLY